VVVKESANEALITEDLSTAFVILMSAASLAGATMGHIAAVGGVDDFTPIKDLKAWWQKRKSDKVLKSIINKIKDDEDVVKFMKLTPAQQRGKFRSLIATKLSDTELDYLNKINRSHFRKESAVNEADITVTLNYNTDASDIAYVSNILKKANVPAIVKAGIDDEEVEITVSKANLKKAAKALSADGLELNETLESAVNEEGVESDEQFQEYAFTVLQNAFGDDFDEDKAQEMVDGLISKYSGDYGAMVGAVKASLSESEE
jgi:ribosomal 50S subunit-associated protein YjgA (DUF615 family)